ncbi:RanGTP-binding protein-domain-containing protein [Neohortaea acidophila]|uniref:RanGTP-binding protein-domain-containing protein n=1 Tax=Neohortaea acidophila TaxID=245834 RepID=A0A6A6Q145_9PEZI|nr:RanGTP-binding protein-domain-containing protein [Neohortaea acidophila]KAF2485709.1 RanGTP-binding protein-domain-containing protein [Neohortaea acidophila]
MLFAGHVNRTLDDNGVRATTWKEVVHKARMKLFRVPLGALGNLPGDMQYELSGNGVFAGETGSDFAYQLAIIEDLDDDRVHTMEEDGSLPSSFEDVANAGIRDVVPIHEISKIFYADTGKILNIGEDDDDTNRPVLLIKRDINAEPPRRMLHRSQMSEPRFLDDAEMGAQADEQDEINIQILRESTPSIAANDQQGTMDESKTWKLPANLDPEWMAFEVYTEQSDSDSEVDEPPAFLHPSHQHADSPGTAFTHVFSNMKLKSPSPQPIVHVDSPQPQHPRIKTSLSLLEMLIKLTALQQFRQESHLAIEDELLNFFLEDSATAGAGRDKDVRRKVRNEAVKRVGFDPYDESPVKRRGEVYIASARARAEGDLLEPEVRESIEEACENCGSPSPRSVKHAETPVKMGTPPYLKPSGRMSESVEPEMNGLAKTMSQASLLATPPSTTKGRHMVLRAQSEPKASSPLSREFTHDDEG